MIDTDDDQPMAAPDATDARRATRSGGSRRSVLGLLERYALVLLTVAVAVFFSVYGPTASVFLTSGNLQVMIGGQSVLAIVALAALVPLICGQFDLSVGAIAGTAAIFCAAALSSGMAVPLAILLAIAIGVAAGTVNALIITRGGVNAVIATLGTAAILGGIINQKTHGLALVSNIPRSVVSFGTGNWLGIPRTAYVMVLFALAVYYMLAYTPFGRHLQALGSNAQAAGLVGLRTDRLLGMTFVISGALSGAAGALLVARSGGADPRSGEAFTLPALAAAFLSAAAIAPGRYNVLGGLVAIFFLAVLNSGLTLAGAEPYVNQYVNGAALIVGVGLAAYLGRKRASAGS